MKKVHLRIFGPFAAAWEDGTEIYIRSAKLRALIVLLAVAPDGRRTRSWLQDMLWSLSGTDLGRASLRRGLSDLRRVFGASFDILFHVTNAEIRLRQEHYEIVGKESDGPLLEGIDVSSPSFQSWLDEQRRGALPVTVRASQIAVSERIRPSVAILPLGTMNGDAAHRHFGDILAQEITRTLSRSHFLDIISHLSSRNLNLRVLDLAAIRHFLGCDYVVSGTFRLSGDRFRIDADLIDTESGHICWTREFEGEAAQFFAGQSDAVIDCASTIAHSILTRSVALATSRPLPDVDSHALFMSGVALMHRQSLASFARARSCIEEVISRVPNESVLHAWLGKWYVLSVQQGWSVDLSKDSRAAADCTRRALDLDPGCSFSLAVDGFVHNNLLKQYDEAFSRLKMAIEIDPNNGLGWLLKGTLHAFMDEGAEGVACTRRALRLSPMDPHSYFYDSLSAAAALSNGDFEDALMLAERSLKANRRHTSTLRAKTVALHGLGRMIEARATAQELLQLEPSLTIKNYLAKHPAASFRVGRAWADALRDAGVPEG